MISYTGNNVAGTAPGYVSKAWFAPLHWFDNIWTETPGTGIIYGPHLFTDGYGWIECYALPRSVGIDRESKGTTGADVSNWKPKLFIPGDSSSLQDMLYEMVNLPFILLVQDEQQEAFLQFGSALNPLYLSSVKQGSATITEGTKGWMIESLSVNRFFYLQEAPVADMLATRFRDMGYKYDTIDTTAYAELDGIIRSKANFIMPAYAYTSGTVYALNNRMLPVPVPFTRTSSATRYNISGNPELLAAGMPRLYYDPVTHALKGYLMERQSTNLVTTSEPSTGGTGSKWGNLNLSNCSLAVDSLWGFVRQFKITENSSGSAQVHYVVNGSVSGTAQVLSFHAKANGRTKLYLSNGATIDLGNGTATGGTAIVTSMGNGWYSVQALHYGSGFTWQVSLLDGSGNSSYAGDGTSGIFIRMLQIESGKSATSYIPTYGTAVTREPDIISYSNAINAGYVNANAATTYADIRSIDDPENKCIFGIGFLPESALNETTGFDKANASYSQEYDTGTLTAQSLKTADQYTATTIKEYTNGASVVNTAYTTDTDLTGVYLRTDAYSLYARCIALFKDALLNAELMQITT